MRTYSIVCSFIVASSMYMSATFHVPALDYEVYELEPYISRKIMQLHRDKHHAGYVDGLNATVSQPGFEQYKTWDMTRLLLYVNTLPEAIRDDVRFFGGGHANHAFFWRTLCPSRLHRVPQGALRDQIDHDFGSFATLQDTFSHVAAGVRGSGWAWLVIKQDGKLAVRGTYNHDTPLSQGEIPILVLDVWEHAYYLKYHNKRGDYISNWWNIVNWDYVERLYYLFAHDKEPVTRWFTHVLEIPYTSVEKAKQKNRASSKKRNEVVSPEKMAPQ